MAQYLLSILEDPLNLLPLRGVSLQLSQLIHDSEKKRAEWCDGRWGSGFRPTHMTVEEELEAETQDLLIGSGFVLAQTAITQTVSIATGLASFAGKPRWLPSGKEEIMNTEAQSHPVGCSIITLINSVANYIKHHYEWPPDWQGGTTVQQRTIERVLSLGLAPRGRNNLRVALQQLGTTEDDMEHLGDLIQEWRERLASFYRSKLSENGQL